MNKEFIPYEQALELKELGFDGPCLAFYNGKFLESTDYDFDNNNSKDIGLCIVAPLYQQAFRWFRENHGIMYTVDNNIVGNTFHGSFTKINSNYESDYTDDFATYEDAQLASLKKLIEIVKNK